MCERSCGETDSQLRLQIPPKATIICRVDLDHWHLWHLTHTSLLKPLLTLVKIDWIMFFWGIVWSPVVGNQFTDAVVEVKKNISGVFQEP